MIEEMRKAVIQRMKQSGEKPSDMAFYIDTDTLVELSVKKFREKELSEKTPSIFGIPILIDLTVDGWKLGPREPQAVFIPAGQRRLNRITRLLSKIQREITVGIERGEIGETLAYQFDMADSKVIKGGKVSAIFEVKPTEPTNLATDTFTTTPEGVGSKTPMMIEMRKEMKRQAKIYNEFPPMEYIMAPYLFEQWAKECRIAGATATGEPNASKCSFMGAQIRIVAGQDPWMLQPVPEDDE